MKISILGTGMVGQTLTGKMLELGYEVYLGTRDVSRTKTRSEPYRLTGKSFSEWHRSHPSVALVNYGQLPGDSDMFINATGGGGSLNALRSVGSEKLSGKTLLDIANPLDFSQGSLSLFVNNTDSLAEQIQREFPGCHVVKGLNTMNCRIMVNPDLVPGEHHAFICGNEQKARQQVHDLLNAMGWKDSMILDLGDIEGARGMEMILPAWVRIVGVLGNSQFNFHIVRGSGM